jgi:glyoxalase family protein
VNCLDLDANSRHNRLRLGNSVTTSPCSACDRKISSFALNHCAAARFRHKYMRQYRVKLHGVHHITAIATDPQRNLDFYTQFLGLRLVKRTVNFDDPSAYHFYFGDSVGTPGTILTFFPWPGARRGSRGAGQVVATTFAIPPSAIDFWQARLKEHHVTFEKPSDRFDEEVLRFTDPDGLLLELIGTTQSNQSVDLSYEKPIPEEFALRGFHAPTLELQKADLTIQLLTDLFGFEIIAEQGSRRRFSINRGGAGKQLDLIEQSQTGFGQIAAGTVHHIAFRAASDEEQREWRQKLIDLGLAVTSIIDRQYFHSIYFREPGGILFEIATDRPGFLIDESVDQLGESLKLPPQFETHRSTVEQSLPPISLHHHSSDTLR